MSSESRDHGDVLDSTEDLVAQDGIEAVTIRALTKVTGVSNGAIYRTFESRGGLLGRVWIRAERRFLDLMTSLVGEAGGDPFDAVYAAAETSLRYPERYPGSAACLMTVRRHDVISQAMPTEIAEQLRELECELTSVMAQLAESLWGRCDADAVALVATCIVDLPKWLRPQGMRYSTGMLSDYLRAAVRSVLQVGPPPVAVSAGTTANGPAQQLLNHRVQVSASAWSTVGYTGSATLNPQAATIRPTIDA